MSITLPPNNGESYVTDSITHGNSLSIGQIDALAAQGPI